MICSVKLTVKAARVCFNPGSSLSSISRCATLNLFQCHRRNSIATITENEFINADKQDPGIVGEGSIVHFQGQEDTVVRIWRFAIPVAGARTS
jgi:hypothetical protein